METVLVFKAQHAYRGQNHSEASLEVNDVIHVNQINQNPQQQILNPENLPDQVYGTNTRNGFSGYFPGCFLCYAGNIIRPKAALRKMTPPATKHDVSITSSGDSQEM
ncbi:hypothetical protein Anas_05198 [Armadillidium nasatum]|uniref:Uncharacterized protein n=1 Tax=Armadillidium nasatum TaxID=96803 RepID=A0A5N5SQT7_9CRUS|nr:hypothetical protein Anas_05198 [Armadillidium nasatum]